MKTIVLVKVVDGEINPFDKSALEVALSIEKNDVTVISMGPESWTDNLRELTRLGAQRVILLSDKVFAGSDTLATSYILSEAIKKLKFDLILCGRKTLDGETGQVGPCLAEMLGIPVITNVLECEINKSGIKCKTELGAEKTSFPALLTLNKIKDLRFPSIFSKTGEIEVWSNEKICADIKRCGLSGSPTKVIDSFESVKGERKCRFIDTKDFAPLLNELLKRKKRENEIKQSKNKLKSVWAVGEEVLPAAKAIAENVTVIPKDTPEKIAELAKKEKPHVILWNADVWGRREAPRVQSLLQTGLCADCTELETDGKKLFMIRPAKAGNITAKIKCDTYPQMATVRTSLNTAEDIIVSAGKGVIECTDEVREFAKAIGAGFGASRGLVDAGCADYKYQVGLTGRTVNPKIYIAIGISGAVHHIAGIKDSDTVIAVNPDKDARIFKFSDYGIVCGFNDFYKELKDCGRS